MAVLERSARLWLFHLKHLLGERSKLSFNVTREICQYLADLQLVHVTETFLCFLKTSTWGSKVRLRAQIQADVDSRWVVLEDGRVFCCGGRYIAAVYILGRDGSVEQKVNMSVGRGAHGECPKYNMKVRKSNSHGLLQANLLYVFGGYNESEDLNTCEKLELSLNKWSLLPSMREFRAYFNPSCSWE